VPRNVNNVNK